MSDHTTDFEPVQRELFDPEQSRTLLDQLLENSRLYTSSEDYRRLLDFVVRLRNFAPFNAMLLQVQKPGLFYAASARDWRERFGRQPKEGARPLLILWPFGPVALVYDVVDTDGKPLPDGVDAFSATGDMDSERVKSFVDLLAKKNFDWVWADDGDGKAGAISVVRRSADDKDFSSYKMRINKNHLPSVQFATIAHELGHLCLGHLGPDKKLNIPRRAVHVHAQQELEAESVAYLVCERNGVKSKSETYLANYVNANTTIDQIDRYQIMRAAGQVETLLGLVTHTKFDKV